MSHNMVDVLTSRAKVYEAKRIAATDNKKFMKSIIASTVRNELLMLRQLARKIEKDDSN